MTTSRSFLQAPAPRLVSCGFETVIVAVGMGYLRDKCAVDVPSTSRCGESPRSDCRYPWMSFFTLHRVEFTKPSPDWMCDVGQLKGLTDWC